MADHPDWCEQARCRAAAGGAHVSQSRPIEADRSRVTAYLHQLPTDRAPNVMLSVGYRGNGMAVPLPTEASAQLRDQLTALLIATGPALNDPAPTGRSGGSGGWINQRSSAGYSPGTPHRTL